MILEIILCVHLADNVKARRLLPDGRYERISAFDGARPVHAQKWLLENRGVWQDKI